MTVGCVLVLGLELMLSLQILACLLRFETQVALRWKMMQSWTM